MILILSFSVSAQQNEEEELAGIRKEIIKFRKLLAENAEREKTTLESLQALDEEIRLREKYLGKITRTEKDISWSIRKNKRGLRDLKSELKDLQTGFKNRAVNMYKHGRSSMIDQLANRKSASQMVSLRKYYLAMSERDRKKIGTIGGAAENITITNEKLANELTRQAALVKEAQQEKNALNNKRAQRAQLLKIIRSDKDQVQLALEEKQAAESALIETITRITNPEKNSTAAEVDLSEFTRFTEHKGILPWPVSGEIVTHAGLINDPRTKTKVMNRGIDIRTVTEAEVSAVCGGKVAQIKWLPWYGQTVFLQHREGFYTVYARLAAIDVVQGQAVERGMRIGKAGTVSGTSDTSLHFQVWKDGSHLDPEEWLSKSNRRADIVVAQAKKN